MILMVGIATPAITDTDCPFGNPQESLIENYGKGVTINSALAGNVISGVFTGNKQSYWGVNHNVTAMQSYRSSLLAGNGGLEYADSTDFYSTNAGVDNQRTTAINYTTINSAAIYSEAGGNMFLGMGDVDKSCPNCEYEDAGSDGIIQKGKIGTTFGSNISIGTVGMPSTVSYQAAFGDIGDENYGTGKFWTNSYSIAGDTTGYNSKPAIEAMTSSSYTFNGKYNFAGTFNSYAVHGLGKDVFGVVTVNTTPTPAPVTATIKQTTAKINSSQGVVVGIL